MDTENAHIHRAVVQLYRGTNTYTPLDTSVKCPLKLQQMKTGVEACYTVPPGQDAEDS